MGFGILAVIMILMMAPITAGSQDPDVPPGLPAAPDGPTDVIVVLDPGVNPEQAARAVGAKPKQVYTDVFDGFAATLSPKAIAALERNPRVETISPDLPVRAFDQTLPTGIDRVDAEKGAQSTITYAGSRVDVDVAVIDTGIANVRELRVKGGKSCIGGESYDDDNGHGTHVAGIIGAKNNSRGVVGVAPGARLWAVKVLDRNGIGSTSSVICGLDWVVRHQNKIEVVNMSLGGPGSDGRCSDDAYHKAVCKVNQAGIPVVVAAGNSSERARKTVPATWKQTITVSALADLDGKPPVVGEPNALGCRGEEDDTFASFSNYGPDIDIAAPGVCIDSVSRRGRTETLSGTSMATPHVAGAVALYKSRNPRSSTKEVRNWLLTDASEPQTSGVGFTGDPDGDREPVLYLGPDLVIPDETAAD